MRTIVFGDTGGHAIPLLAALKNIGLNMETLKLPQNVQVIHLGDLVHKGPHSNELMLLVNSIMVRNPGQWHQILGNHEYNYIQDAPDFWFDELNLNSRKILDNWIENKLAYPAFSLPANNSFVIPDESQNLIPQITDKGFLFTHAGVTRKFWKHIKTPDSASTAERTINALSVKEVTRPGIMLETMSPTHNPGPVWALGTSEVFQSWESEPYTEMPFIQVHGHTSPYNWFFNAWYSTASLKFRQKTVLDYENRLSFTNVAGSLQIGCDPSFDKESDLTEQPFLLLED